MTASKKRVAIMISGRGSNMAALMTAAAERDYPAEIVGVISDKPDAPGLVYAADKGIATRVVERRHSASKAEHDLAIDAELRLLNADIIALAGYMRLFTPGFVDRWSGRLVNIHPALLPSFRGLDTHRRALDTGVRIHGCTVHFVTAEMDEGPIVAQAAVPVLVDDTAEALAARVLKAEHRLYPTALAMVIRGEARLVGGRAVFDGLVDGQARQSGSLFAPQPLEAPGDLEHLARFTP